jgi:copper chaperone CopZ
MNKTLLSLSLIACLTLPAAAAAVQKSKSAATLSAGRYSAKVKMLACEACGPSVEKTLNEIKGVEAAKVDPKTSTVEFAVKNSVKVASLQKALRGASADMGMGADYSLSKIQAIETAAAPEAPKTDKTEAPAKKS